MCIVQTRCFVVSLLTDAGAAWLQLQQRFSLPTQQSQIAYSNSGLCRFLLFLTQKGSSGATNVVLLLVVVIRFSIPKALSMHNRS